MRVISDVIALGPVLDKLVTAPVIALIACLATRPTNTKSYARSLVMQDWTTGVYSLFVRKTGEIVSNNSGLMQKF